MNTNYNTSVNFTSTYIPGKVSLTKATNVIEPYFELKGFSLKSISEIRNRIRHGQAGINWDNSGYVFVGKDREADEFIAGMVKKSGIDYKYVQDTPEAKFKDSVLDTTV